MGGPVNTLACEFTKGILFVNDSTCKPELIFIGPLPPPVHGQSVATDRLRTTLTAAGVKLRVIDSGAGERGGAFRRLWNAARACLCVLLSRIQVVYLSVNSNRGIIITIMICALSRLRRKKVVLHHHSYRYIGSHDRMMSLLAWVAGESSLHVVNCSKMAEELKSRYCRVKLTQSYNNVGVVSTGLMPADCGVRYALGHLSNLTEAKGLGRAIEAFRNARKIWPTLSLHVGGPCSEKTSESQIARAQQEFGEAFVYHGAVYGVQKKEFFDAIDVFVFPSLYAVETQGIVNLEALSCGKPVVAFAQCCIPEDISTSGGAAVPKNADFSAALSTYYGKFLEDPVLAQTQARKRFLEIQQTHEQEKMSLLTFFNFNGLNTSGSI